MSLFKKRPGLEPRQAAARPPRYGLLLVDDEMFNLTTLAALLEDEYAVFTATSGVDALSLLADPAKAAQIQAIVSDQRMPGMNGVELLSEVSSRYPGMKRVLLTGYTDIEAIIAAINEAAIYKYLRKPVDSHELRLTLRRALECWQLEQDKSVLVEELGQAMERLRLLDADKLEFLRYLDHEMNTPLNWMGATQVLDRNQFSPDVREILGFVDQGQGRLKALVTTVLRYFQLASLGRVTPTATIDLTVMLAEKVSAHSRHCFGVGVELRQPPTVHLLSHDGLLGELLDHLLENALAHARRSDQPQVTISVEDAVDAVAVTIHNTGRGLDADELAQLFRPFRYGSDHGEHGFGISLATARAASLALGAELDAISEGKGSGVSLRLRLRRGQA
jgi:signal transduction histidine kinase